MAFPSHLNARRATQPSLLAEALLQAAHRLCSTHFMQQATCQFPRRCDPALAPILHGNRAQGRNRMKSMMYQAYQNHMDLTAPWRTGAAAALKYLNLVPQGVSDKLFGRLAGALELISRTSLTYTRPPYSIDKVLVGNQELEVTEEVTYATPFGSLLHFK